MSGHDKSRIPFSDIAVDWMQQKKSIPWVANTINDIRVHTTPECCEHLDILDRYLRRGQVWGSKDECTSSPFTWGRQWEASQSSADSPVTMQVPSCSTIAVLKSACDVCICNQASDTLSLTARMSTSLSSSIHKDIESQWWWEWLNYLAPCSNNGYLNFWHQWCSRLAQDLAAQLAACPSSHRSYIQETLTIWADAWWRDGNRPQGWWEWNARIHESKAIAVCFMSCTVWPVGLVDRWISNTVLFKFTIHFLLLHSWILPINVVIHFSMCLASYIMASIKGHHAITWLTWNSQERQLNVLYVLKVQHFVRAAKGEKFSHYIIGDQYSLWCIDRFPGLFKNTKWLHQEYQTFARQCEPCQLCHLVQYLNIFRVQKRGTDSLKLTTRHKCKIYLRRHHLGMTNQMTTVDLYEVCRGCFRQRIGTLRQRTKTPVGKCSFAEETRNSTCIWCMAAKYPLQRYWC